MVFLLVFVLLSGSAVMAQEDTLGVSSQRKLDDKNWALLFQVNSNFTLRSFQGSVISVKKHLSPQKALRIGVSLDADLRDQDLMNFREVRDHDTQDVLNDELDESISQIDQLELDISAQFLHYFLPQNDVSVFVGMGNFWEIGRMKSNRQTESQSNNYPGSMREFEAVDSHTRYSWALGLSGVLGVEWFCLKSISLIGEYGLVVGYRSVSDTHYIFQVNENTSRTPASIQENKIKEQQWYVRGNAVKFGVSVYF